MRAFPWIALAGLAATGAAVAGPVKGIGQPAHCRDNPALHLARPDAPGLFRKLTDLPPAHAFYSMLERGADGCITPVLFGTRSGERTAPRAPRAIVPRSFP